MMRDVTFTTMGRAGVQPLDSNAKLRSYLCGGVKSGMLISADSIRFELAPQPTETIHGKGQPSPCIRERGRTGDASRLRLEIEGGADKTLQNDFLFNRRPFDNPIGRTGPCKWSGFDWVQSRSLSGTR
jgi:hypothetical protein